MKRIRNLDKHLIGLEKNEKFNIGLDIDKINKSRLVALGLDSLSINESTLPTMIGPVSRFNARGKFRSLKDLPKEDRYITTREWTREEWIGGGQTQTVTSHVDIYRECYQQEFLPPPSIELTKIKSEKTFFISDELVNSASNEELILHTINMYLELFGEFDILRGGKLVKVKTVKVNWRFLPPGEKIWSKILEHIKEHNNKGDSILNVITERQEFIEKLNPKMTYVGAGGFSDYIAYLFEDFTILESIAFGNALYIFKDNWKNLSQLTKGELLKKNLAKRIIHTNGWKIQVSNLFKKK